MDRVRRHTRHWGGTRRMRTLSPTQTFDFYAARARGVKSSATARIPVSPAAGNTAVHAHRSISSATNSQGAGLCYRSPHTQRGRMRASAKIRYGSSSGKYMCFATTAWTGAKWYQLLDQALSTGELALSAILIVANAPAVSWTWKARAALKQLAASPTAKQ